MRPAPIALLIAAAASLAGCASAGDAPPDGSVTVEGNSALAAADLYDMARLELRSFSGRGRHTADLADAAYAMERGLHDLGYAHAAVTFTAEPSEARPERVVFEVEEGPLAHLGEVRFPGAHAFPRERLMEFFEFPPTGFLSLSKAPYRLSDVEGAIADIGRLYMLEGYADVVVGPAVISWSADRALADVSVPVVERQRYVVKSVRVRGAGSPALEARLMRVLDLTGRPWHARVAAEAAARVKQALLEEGRRAAVVTGDAEVESGDSPGARIVVSVRPGPVFRAGDVTVTGNERTDADFLRGLVPIRDADVLRESALDEALDRLYGTGVLRSADIETPRETTSAAPLGGDDGDGGDGARSDLRVVVEELEARSVEAGLGYGSYERARGHVEYRDRNLFGLARELSMRTHASLVGEGVDASLSDRYLLGRSNTVQLSAAWSRREEPSFERQALSAETSVRRDFRDGLWARAGYRIRAERAERRAGRIPGAEEEGFVRSAGLFVQAARDTRDDPLFPGSGSLLEASLFRSAPALGADLDFLEPSLAASKYFKLHDDTVLAVGGRFATRDPQDSRRTLPIQERLFLGGAESVRSFQESELGPFNASNEPVGGLTALEMHVELRRRIRGSLEGALFYDVGTIGADSWEIDGPRGHALGVGLRYHLPVGPIRLDFGWNPGERFAASDPWAIHLSFGFSF